jgi:ubiquinone/menaquinone biosynthesis C-methylase UbiE
MNSGLAGRVSRQIPGDASVLEVAPGPGYFAIKLARLGRYRVTGLDISRTLVEIARTKAAEAGVAVDFRQGDAAHMPFAPESFDFLLCRAAFKNFMEPLPALKEMYRVLKPGGHALIIDLRRDASMRSISEAVQAMHLGAVNAMITRLTFRFMLLRRAYTKEEFQKLLAQTKFGPIDIREDTIGLELALQRT